MVDDDDAGVNDVSVILLLPMIMMMVLMCQCRSAWNLLIIS
jgi:hypothetical protein